MRASLDSDPGPAERLADILEWLFVVFEKRLGLAQVLATVHDNYLALNIDTNPAAIHGLERIAFDHLHELATSHPTDGPQSAVDVVPAHPDEPDGGSITVCTVLDILEDFANDDQLCGVARTPGHGRSGDPDSGCGGIVEAVLARAGLPSTALTSGEDGLPRLANKGGPRADRQMITIGAVLALRAAAATDRRAESSAAAFTAAVKATSRLMDLMPNPCELSAPTATDMSVLGTRPGADRSDACHSASTGT